MTHFSTDRTKWKRVSRRHQCPVCGKSDWCLYTGADDSPDAAICARIESDKIVGTRGAGWVHRLRDSGDCWRDRPRQVRVEVEDAPTFDFAALASECHAALGYCTRGLLAGDLGVTPDALDLMRVGWSARHHATTWPMHDGDGRICGIRLRGHDGRKWAVRGSRSGLFVARGRDPLGGDHAIPGTLVIVEGATDAAAMLSIGVECVGRPSCSGGTDAILNFCSPELWRCVAIFADSDAPGQRGARSLAARLVGYVRDGVRIVTPPAKDAREWIRAGADRLDVLDAIDAAPLLTLTYGVNGGTP